MFFCLQVRFSRRRPEQRRIRLPAPGGNMDLGKTDSSREVNFAARQPFRAPSGRRRGRDQDRKLDRNGPLKLEIASRTRRRCIRSSSRASFQRHAQERERPEQAGPSLPKRPLRGRLGDMPALLRRARRSQRLGPKGGTRAADKSDYKPTASCAHSARNSPTCGRAQSSLSARRRAHVKWSDAVRGGHGQGRRQKLKQALRCNAAYDSAVRRAAEATLRHNLHTAYNHLHWLSTGRHRGTGLLMLSSKDAKTQRRKERPLRLCALVNSLGRAHWGALVRGKEITPPAVAATSNILQL